MNVVRGLEAGLISRPMTMWRRFLHGLSGAALISVAATSVAAGSELSGKVVEVNDDQVKIELQGDLAPNAGDEVKLEGKIEDLPMPVAVAGDWEITRVEGRFAWAENRGAEGAPEVGFAARIHSSAPVAIETATETEDSRAAKHRQACGAGDASGCTNLGYLYDKGTGVRRNMRRAAELYRKGCDGGSARGCTNLGYLYREGLGVERDERRAAKLFREGCEGDDAWGCGHLGYVYRNGLGVESDEQRAAGLYARGCDMGAAWSCGNLGRVYSDRGDFERALEYLKKAVDMGDDTAIRSIGYLYQTVGDDRAQALRWYRQAAKAGNPDAANDIGVFYENGWVVDRDYEAAARWYRKAVDRGLARGNFNLAELYEHGLGVSADRDRAIELYRKAARAGVEVARDWLREQSLQW